MSITYPSQALTITFDQLGSDGLPAASTHTATLWKNGVVTAVTVTVAATATTGVYSAAFTIPSNAAQNDVYEVRVADAAGYKATIWRGTVDLYVLDTVSYSAAALYGACADPQTAAETYAITINGSTYTLDYTSQTSAGVRGTTTRTKT